MPSELEVVGGSPSELEIVGGAPYTWENIVGEYRRTDAKALLGALMNAQQNPAFAQQIARMAAAGRPVMHQQPLVKARAWEIGIGPVYIGPNAVRTFTVSPQCFFRVEKFMAADITQIGSGFAPGYGTTILAVSVGQKNQFPVGAGIGGVLSAFHAPSVLGNGVEWDTCQPAMTISISVQDNGVTAGGSTWICAMFGKAVVG